ncbi:phytanoyl-CoA dioxygenase family protein [Sphingomonas sp. Leaf208]|uniref:phytanoyl-CoA dioxygenase family protein n=1 Tax=Sphingomonas sp. Leaf208 TaxID=1735679 RepID=UPI00138F106A|nr:phytanoyl-CoA dioxygenase family protein [Sphingomonas sp. Leaf208]
MRDMVSASDADAVTAFERDGAAVVRGAIEPGWIAAMRDAIADAMNDTGAAFTTRNGFYNGFLHWRRNPVFRDFLLDSALPDIAQRFLRARHVNFFYDQLIVKQPGLPSATPWHLDSTYFPTREGKVLSIWIPFDHASPTSGAVTYFKGSHRWVHERGRVSVEAFVRDLPEPGSEIEGHEFLAWTLEPGDVLIHDVDTLHGAPATGPTAQRRALATRWTDQDVRYDPRADDFFHMGRNSGLPIPEIALETGAALTSELFPIAWPKRKPDTIKA